MKISHYQLRTLIESVILEGFKNDQQYLAEKYPEHSQDIFRLQPKWISWLMARFGDSPTQKEIHPFSDAILTVLNFSKKDAAIGEKWKSNEQFRAAINARFPEGERSWRSPTDVTTMTVDQIELILGLAERKKQRIELKDDVISVEGDRVGKVGPWNIWLPTTRENSCKIAGYDPVTMKPKTTWCTARTSGSNLFYNYVGRSGHEITLFYIIKDNPTHDEDWLSLGFINGKPELDGKNGGVSVDRDNKGLTMNRLQSILGPHHNEIMNVMIEKNKSLGGKHPARQKIIDAAQSVEALQYLLSGLSKDEADDIKKVVIANPDLCADVIRIFAIDSNPNIKSSVAMHKNLPQDVFFKLAKDNDQNIRSAIARNQNAPQDILRTLSKDPKLEVRTAIASNEHIQQDIFRKFAEDPNETIRKSIASNPSAPQDVLHKLAGDSKKFVRIYVAINPNISQEVIRKLSDDPVPQVKSYVAMRKDIPQDIVHKLAKDTDKWVRINVASNPNISKEILINLLKDENKRVRDAAAETLKKLEENNDN